VMSRPLAGQVAVVTGAGRGIGRGGAVLLGGFGAKVSLLARTLSELEETRRMVLQQGGEALVCRVDLEDPSALIAALRKTEEQLGRITHLCNNAAVLDLLPFEQTTPDLWNRAMNVNLSAAYHAMRYVYPKMAERGSGSIHNVSSAAGIKGFVNETAYCASKYALEGLSRALALEAVTKGVIVTLSSPGIRTKPTSVTMAEYKSMPGDRRALWADPLLMGEAFAYLASARLPEIAGRRFDLYRLSQLVRERGTLDLDLTSVLAVSS